MKKLEIFFLTITVLFLFSCEPDSEGHQFITLVNKSDTKIKVQIVHSSKITPSDTLWRCGLTTFSIESESKQLFVSAGADKSQKGWEGDFKYIPFIQFLIFDAELYDSIRDYEIPCSEVDYTIPVKYYYQLKLEDLERMNWVVVYPPLEE